MNRRDRLILLATVLATALPPLVDLATSGVAGAVRYSAADAFYYHTVARNIARLGHITYDQVYPTNGFHPLWQFMLSLVYVFPLRDSACVVISILCSLALVTGSVYFAGRAIIAAKGSLSGWFITFPIGAYGFFMTPFWYYCREHKLSENSIEGPPQFYGILYSYINGMETPVALILFSIIALRFCRDAPRRPWVDGLLLALLVLARLDLVFIAGPILAWRGLEFLRARDLRTVVALGAAFVLPIVAYLLFNHAYCGMFLPVSGATKTSFPHPSPANVYVVGRVVEWGFHDVDSFFRGWRLAQMLIPAIFALVAVPALLFRWRRLDQGFALTLGDADRLDRFLAVASIGVMILSAYNFWFVLDWAQGHWYYAISIVWMSLATIAILSRFGRGWRVPEALVIGVGVAVTLAIFVGLFRRPESHADQAHLLSIEKQIRYNYYPQKPKLLDYDDGIIAYVTDFPSMNALGLSVDKEAGAALRNGELPALAYSRGFNRVAVFSYNPLDLSKASKAEIDGYLPNLRLGPVRKVELEYAISGTRFGIFRVFK